MLRYALHAAQTSATLKTRRTFEIRLRADFFVPTSPKSHPAIL